MSTFVLVHGAGDTGWSWHLAAAALRERGHQVFAPDLPGDDEALTLEDYADAVMAAVGGVIEAGSWSATRSADSRHRSSPTGCRPTSW